LRTNGGGSCLGVARIAAQASRRQHRQGRWFEIARAFLPDRRTFAGSRPPAPSAADAQQHDGGKHETGPRQWSRVNRNDRNRRCSSVVSNPDRSRCILSARGAIANGKVRWPGDRSLAALAGREIELRFHLRHARLFTFTAASAQPPQ